MNGVHSGGLSIKNLTINFFEGNQREEKVAAKMSLHVKKPIHFSYLLWSLLQWAHRKQKWHYLVYQCNSFKNVWKNEMNQIDIQPSKKYININI